MKRICGIYLLTHIASGKIYVGQSVNFTRRWWSHGAGNKPQCPKLHNAIKKYGKSAFAPTILEECNQDQLTIREQFYLDTLKPFGARGYNIATQATPGASCKGIPKTGATAKGKSNCHNKSVCQYNEAGLLVATHYSIQEAAGIVGINYMGITNCVQGRARTAGGFFWSLEGTLPTIRSRGNRLGMTHSALTKQKISNANKGNRGLSGGTNPSSKTTTMQNLQTGEVIQYDTIREVSQILNVHQTTVARKCRNGRWNTGKYVVQII